MPSSGERNAMNCRATCSAGRCRPKPLLCFFAQLYARHRFNLRTTRNPARLVTLLCATLRITALLESVALCGRHEYVSWRGPESHLPQVPMRSGAFILRNAAITDSAVMRPVLGFSEGMFSIDIDSRAESDSTLI